MTFVFNLKFLLELGCQLALRWIVGLKQFFGILIKRPIPILVKASLLQVLVEILKA